MEAKNIVNFNDNDITNLTLNFNEKEAKRKKYITFQLSEPVSSFTGRKTELLKIHSTLEEQKKLVICGLGGIGKSELIRAYCKEYQNSYENNIIWINAETHNDLKKSFYELASELNVETSNSLRERNFKEIVKEEYLYFKNQKCLVIFDNALCFKDILPYFPSNSSNLSVLISSQNKEWGNVNTFELNVLTEDESIELMNSLSLSEDPEDVKILLNMLQYLPLAIQQAAAYIIDQKYVSDTYKIRDYINVFNEEEAILAVTYDNAPFPDYSEQLYDKTVYTTLQITLAKIQNEIALELLCICAYLSPDNIEKSLFTPLVTNEDITKLNELIRILEKYFLITVKRDYKYTFIPYYSSRYYNSESSILVKELQQIRQGDIIFVHRVVQKNIRYILKIGKQANSYIEQALALTTNDYVINGIHLASILKYVDENICLHYYTNYCLNKESFLCLLSCEKYIDIFKLLLNSGIDIDITTNSVLPTYVALSGSVDMMKFIIEKGVNIYKKNRNGIYPIQAASQNNQLDLVSYLIEQGASINVVDSKGYTPLHSAVINNHLDIVKYLINKGASITAIADDGCTVLIIAAQYGYLEMTKYLLTIGCGIDVSDNEGFIPLHFAAQDGHLQVLDYLLENGASIDYAAKNGFTSLHLATQNGHLEIVQCLVEHGAELDKTGYLGYTALLIATLNKHLHIVEYLVEKGCEVNVSSDLGLTSLHIALLNSNIQIAQFLINCGSNTNAVDIDEDTPLHCAVLQENNLDIIDCLIQNGALIDVPNNVGNLCLHTAAQKGHLDVVKYLIHKNALVNFSNNEGITPLYLASENGFLDIVKYLLENGATDTSTHFGYTAVVIAAKNGFLDIVEFLVNKGFNIDCNNNGFKAIHLACLSGHFEIVQFLIQKGILVDTKIGDDYTIEKSYTPLFVAVVSGHLQIVQYLINHGASINNTTGTGETVIHLAAENGKLQMIQYFKSAGMSLDAVANNGFIPLHLACTYGNLDVVKYLVDFGSSINHPCNNGFTPLHIASCTIYLHVVEYLINSGAIINQVCNSGLTATDLAILSCHIEVAQYLLAHGGVTTYLEDEN